MHRSDHDVSLESGVDAANFLLRNGTTDERAGIRVDHEAGDTAKKSTDQNRTDGVWNVRIKVQREAHRRGCDCNAEDGREVFSENDGDARIVATDDVLDESHVCLFGVFPAHNTILVENMLKFSDKPI